MFLKLTENTSLPEHKWLDQSRLLFVKVKSQDDSDEIIPDYFIVRCHNWAIVQFHVCSGVLIGVTNATTGSRR